MLNKSYFPFSFPLKQRCHPPGNTFSKPYMWGTMSKDHAWNSVKFWGDREGCVWAETILDQESELCDRVPPPLTPSPVRNFPHLGDNHFTRFPCPHSFRIPCSPRTLILMTSPHTSLQMETTTAFCHLPSSMLENLPQLSVPVLGLSSCCHGCNVPTPVIGRPPLHSPLHSLLSPMQRC